MPVQQPKSPLVSSIRSTPALPLRFWHRRRWRILFLVLLLLVILSTCSLGAISWYYSDQLLQVSHPSPTYPLHVIRATATTVTLNKTPVTQRQGLYGLDWAHGHAIIGMVLSSDTTGVTRQMMQATGPILPGMPVNLDVNVYQGTPAAAFGLAYTNVQIPGPLGIMPAWYISGKKSTWVLVIHGYGDSRENGLRVLPTLSHLGFPVLDLTYRNDVGAPRSPDGLYHLGDTEWNDVEAGVRYALNHGANGVVLYGWSMGGGIVETFLHRSSFASYTRAVVLDSPALDWRSILDNQAHLRHLPAFLTAIAESTISWRIHVNLDTLNQIADARNLTTPTLLFHGTDDHVVPVTLSDAFAHARPDLVTYYRFSGADHTRSWNMNSKRYIAALEAFLLQKVR